MKLSVIDSACQDLIDGYHFYEKQRAGLGNYFLDTLYADIESLSQSAGCHLKVFGLYRSLSRRFPFAIYYDIENEAVLIYAVLDCRRRPSWIRSRVKKAGQ